MSVSIAPEGITIIGQQAQLGEQPMPQAIPFNPPAAAPHAVSAQNPDEEARTSRLRRKAEDLRNAPRSVPINDVAIIIGMRTKQGRQEVIHDIGPEYRILKCTHEVVEKVRAVTEEGVFLGYEPTGEYEMSLKIKYLKE